MALLIGTLLWITSAARAQSPRDAPPPQPTEVHATHRSGQTYITWREVDGLTGESYRIYRHHEPLTAQNLAEAELLAQVYEGSSRFYVNRYYNYDIQAWSERYTERLVIEDHGAPLAEDWGVLAWTIQPNDLAGANYGYGYYAVTTIYSDTENIVDVGPSHIAGPVLERVGAPHPVEIDVGPGKNWHVYIQYMDLSAWNATFHAPNRLNGYYGLAETDDRAVNAIQYAYDYAVYAPEGEVCGEGPLPVVIYLHAWQGGAYGPPRGAKDWCAYQVYPIDTAETWWFGFARDHDYRRGGQPGASDVVVNYTEQRVLRMVYDLWRDPPAVPVDLDRVYVYGHSMGASGALAMALRYPNVFAAAYAGKPMTNYRQGGGWVGTMTPKWGSVEGNLPVESEGPANWAAALARYDGTGIWDWQNHQANLVSRQIDEVAPLGLAQGLDDTSIPWASQGEPLYAALQASRQCWGAEVTDDGHGFQPFRGMAPSLAADEAGIPFAGLAVVRDETVPGLTHSSLEPTVPMTTGTVNHTVRWASSWDHWDAPPVDTVSRWEMSLVAVDPRLGEPGTGITQTIDVTPRRLQRFVATPGAEYLWRNERLSDGSLLDSGVVAADALGVVTVPDVLVLPAGNRLVLIAKAQSRAIYIPRVSH